MKDSSTAGRTMLAALTVAVAVGACARPRGDQADARSAAPEEASVANPGLLYGRVTTVHGEVYEGRLRFGGDEEALWSNYFNGFKPENRWAAHAPRERLQVFAIDLPLDRRPDLGRPFMARFGDITRIQARGRDLQVTLKSGTTVHLDRYAADDFADGVRVWDRTRGVVDLGERHVASIDFLAPPQPVSAPAPLYGTVHTTQGAFTGLIQWDRAATLRSDEVYGHTTADDAGLRFDAIRSIERRPGNVALVRLLNGREVSISTLRGDNNPDRGMYVDDPRYGRVLVSWDAFQRVEFAEGAAAGYGDFRPGRALTGTVITRSGQRLTGRLVYDLDESETTETLDAPSRGVDYTIPFALVASITPATGRVALHSGEQLQLERAGDLGDANAGILVFAEGSDQAEYIAWADVARVELENPASVGSN